MLDSLHCVSLACVGGVIRKYETILIPTAFLICSSAFAECTSEQLKAEIDIKVQRIENGIKTSGNHGYMDQVHISTPSTLMGIPLVAIELTEGEVSSFWIPVAFKITNGVALTTISGYKESIKNFEIAVYYESQQCNRFVQRAI